MMFRTNSPMSFGNNDNSSSGMSPTRMRRANSRGFDQMTPLASDFTPGDDDVLVGRGKKCLVHTGNLRFKQIVSTKLSAYLAAECRVDKTAILLEVIAEVRANSPNGGFVKQNPKTGQYFEVGDFLAKEKTAQAFRDALHEYYSSSNPSKKKRRIQSTMSSEKQSTISNSRKEKKVESDDKNLVSIVHSQFADCPPPPQFARRSISAPTSPLPSIAMSRASRSATPPPSFARFVSDDTFPMPMPALTRAETCPIKRKSSIIMGETLAVLTSALWETGFDSETFFARSNGSVNEDPFEPIPLTMHDNTALSGVVFSEL